MVFILSTRWLHNLELSGTFHAVCAFLGGWPPIVCHAFEFYNTVFTSAAAFLTEEEEELWDPWPRVPGRQRWRIRTLSGSFSGQVDEFPAPVSAERVLLNHPRHFICNSRDLYGASSPPLQPEEELRLGELYFLLPLSALESADNLLALAERLYAAARKEASRAAQPDRCSDSTSDLSGGERLVRMGDDTEVKMTFREQLISKSRSWRPSLQTIEETDFPYLSALHM